MFKAWKRSVYRIYSNDIDALMTQIEADVTNAVIIFEDATKYIGAKLNRDMYRFLIDSKQKNLDVFFVFYSLAACPLDLIRISNFVVLFKTNEAMNPHLCTKFPFTEYSLAETSCQWKKLNYDRSVIVINSNEELEKYIECIEGGYPEIDFSKNTLLLASGYESGEYQANATALLQNAVNKYTLEATLRINATSVMVEWNTAVLVPKISNETNIILTIKHTT